MKILLKTSILVIGILIGIIICKYYCKTNETNPHETAKDTTDSLNQTKRLSGTLLLNNPFPLENEIYLEFCEVDPNEAKIESEKCKTYLQVNGVGKKPRLEAATVPMTEWTRLRNMALTIKPSNCNNYVTGVRISFGLNAAAQTTVLTLFYTPVVMCRTNVSYGQQSEIFGTYGITEGVPHVLNGNTFVPASDLGINLPTYEDNYFERVDMDRDQNSTFENLNHGNNYTDDTKSMVFTFQEIFELSAANGSATSTIIYNSMREIVLPGQSNMMRHSLLITYTGQTVKPQQFVGAKSLTGKYCNLSHMCPPSCNATLLSYRLRN